MEDFWAGFGGIEELFQNEQGVLFYEVFVPLEARA